MKFIIQSIQMKSFLSFSLLACLGFIFQPGISQKNVQENTNYVFSTKDLKRYEFPTHINDLVMDRSEARFSEAFIVVIRPFKGPPIHKHDDTEQLFYMLEGEGTLITGQDENADSTIVKPGDLIRIPVSTWHSVKADFGSEIRYLAVDCFGGIRNEDEPTWDSHVKVLCKEQGWDYDSVVKGD